MTTIEETIRGLKEVRKMFTGYKPNEEMFDMAIRSLEAWEKVREEIQRKANSGQWSEATVFGMSKAIAIIDKHLQEVENDTKD